MAKKAQESAITQCLAQETYEEEVWHGEIAISINSSCPCPAQEERQA